MKHPTHPEIQAHRRVQQRFAAACGYIPPVKTACAWCGTTTREGREPVSHGICPECSAKHFPEDDGPRAA